MLIFRSSITRGAARAGVDAAIARAHERGLLICIAVLDPWGHTITHDRMDGAPFQSMRNAADKAYSIAGNGRSNTEFWNLIKDDPQLVSGASKIAGVNWLGGGLPVLHDDELVGVVGVSGHSSMTEDEEIAEVAVQRILKEIRA